MLSSVCRDVWFFQYPCEHIKRSEREKALGITMVSGYIQVTTR